MAKGHYTQTCMVLAVSMVWVLLLVSLLNTIWYTVEDVYVSIYALKQFCKSVAVKMYALCNTKQCHPPFYKK